MTTSEYEVVNAEKDMPNGDPGDPHNNVKKYTWSDIQTYGELYASRKIAEWAGKEGLAAARINAENGRRAAEKATEEFQRFYDEMMSDVYNLENMVVNIPPIPLTDEEMERLIAPLAKEADNAESAE